MNTGSPDTSLPKVSIGLVVYNHENFITSCLDSIRLQTYSNIELIVSDDCSIDATRAVIKAYKKKYPDSIDILLLPEQNLGVAKNLEYVLSHVTGDYLCFFSGDDLMMPEKVEKQVAAMEEEKNAAMCYSNMVWYNPQKGRSWFKHFGLIQKRPQKLEDLVKDNVLPSPTFFYRKSMFPKEGYDKRVPMICDYKIAVDVWSHHDIVYVDDVLTSYCKHEQSLTAQSYFYGERRTLHYLLKNQLNSNHKQALKYNFALCRYALIMSALKRGQLSRPLKILPRLFPYCFSSRKWCLRFALMMRQFLKSGIKKLF